MLSSVLKEKFLREYWLTKQGNNSSRWIENSRTGLALRKLFLSKSTFLKVVNALSVSSKYKNYVFHFVSFLPPNHFLGFREKQGGI